jgi:GT2 family glycosyltransferase
MIVVSIISHGHGEMLKDLVNQILEFPEVEKIILTINIPENIPLFSDLKVDVVINTMPKGFGANHNAAFKSVSSDFFCVLNPDIFFYENPFSVLMERFNDDKVGLVAPLVNSSVGIAEDSMRHFLTPRSMLKRILGLSSDTYSLRQNSADLTPDWVAGMFMLFRSDVYKKIRGFDEDYFMYCEDVDICTRLWKISYVVVGCLQTKVIHNAQRESHKNIRHLFWHLRSIVRYFLIHSYSMPIKKTLM